MKKELIVGGMHCTSCEALLTDVISDITGAKAGKIDWKAGKIGLECDSEATLKKVIQAIKAEGYKV